MKRIVGRQAIYFRLQDCHCWNKNQMSVELPPVFHTEGEPYKFIATLKRRASKNFRWTSLGSLEDAVCLAYCLYVAGREDEALEACRFLGQMPSLSKLKNNLSIGAKSNLWAWIQNVLALQARLSGRRGIDAEAAECRERMRSVSLFEYRLTGKVLRGYEANVQYALNDGVYMVDRERCWRLNVLIELVVMIELGVSPGLTIPSLEEKLDETIKRLQEMICRPIKLS